MYCDVGSLHWIGYHAIGAIACLKTLHKFPVFRCAQTLEVVPGRILTSHQGGSNACYFSLCDAEGHHRNLCRRHPPLPQCTEERNVAVTVDRIQNYCWPSLNNLLGEVV